MTVGDLASDFIVFSSCENGFGMCSGSDESDFLRDTGNESTDKLRAALWAQRLMLLRVATWYGLSAAVATEWPQAAEAWGAWIAWLDVIAGRLDEFVLTSDGVRPGALVLEPDVLTGMLEELLDVGEVHAVGGVPQADYDWLELLEGIEEASRGVEHFGLVPMGEKSIHRRGVDLLGAVEDSLVLLSFGTEEERESCARSDEIYGLLRAARDDRGWSFLDSNPRALPHSKCVAPEDLSDRDAGMRLLALAQQVADTIVFYEGIGPDGRELNAEERDAAVGRLVAGVMRMRDLARVAPETKLPTPAGQPSTDLRTIMAIVRRMNRSLVLALSDNPSRRSHAMSVEELHDPNRRALAT